jgi:FixJ family two-component response regulator
MSLEQTSRIHSHTNSAADIVVLCAAEETRDAIAHWCGALPTRTWVAEDGYHASDLLQDSPNPTLVTDRVLPPWPGLDIFTLLRARNPGLRIAFVENGNVHDSILAKVTGATVFLTRPLTRSGVIEALACVCDEG